MPTLVLRGLPADLAARLRTYQGETGQSPREAGIALLTEALDARAQRKAASQQAHASMTPEQRVARAHKAVQAREAKRHAAR